MGICYRKAPVTIQAFQFTKESSEDVSTWPAWLVYEFNIHRFRRLVEYNGLNVEKISIDWVTTTLEGDHKVSFGDYIIKEENGGIRSCKPELFAKTYAPANESLQLVSEFDFSEALRQLHQGKHLTRSGWNGKGLFCFFTAGVEAGGLSIKGTYHLQTRQEFVAQWVPSSTDLQATDWKLV